MLHDVRARVVARDRRVASARRGRRVEHGAGAVHQRAHLVARDAEARVRLLEGRLDRREVGVRARVEEAELLVGADRGRRRRVAVVDEREHGRGEDGALRRILRRAVSSHHADLVRVAQRALHERHRHQADDLVDDRTHLRALALLEHASALIKEREEVEVDLRRARGGGAGAAARAEVAAALLGEAVDELAAAAAALELTLERARVEGDALVPRVH